MKSVSEKRENKVVKNRPAKRKLVQGLLLCLVMVGSMFALGACGGDKPADDQGATGNGETIKVGVIYALTGPSAPTGLDQKKAIELGADLINNPHPGLNIPLASGEGIKSLNGAKIEFVFANSEGSPEKGASEAERLINQEKVVALMGCYQSSVVAAASQVAERAGIPFFVVESSSPTLTERGFKYIFRQGPHDAMFGDHTFKFLNENKEALNIKTIGMVYENTAFGTDSASNWTKNAEAGGYEVVVSLPYPANTTSMGSEVQRLKAAKPDVVLAASYVSDATLLMKTFKENNYMPNIVAQDAGFVEQGFFDILGKDAEYAVTREAYCTDFGQINPGAKAVEDLFIEKFGVTNLNGNTSRAVQATLILADAIDRAGSTDPKAIRDALVATDIPGDQLIMPWNGIKFDENGQNQDVSILICQVQGGKYVTVWPKEFATAKLIWPFPAWDKR